MFVLENYVHQFEKNLEVTNYQLEKLPKDLNLYMIKKGFEAIGTFIKAIFSSGKAAVKFAAKDNSGAASDLADTFKELKSLFSMIWEIIKISKEFSKIKKNLSITNEISTNIEIGQTFRESLNSATNLKLEGTTFDEIGRIVNIKLDTINHKTDFKIKRITKVMMALQSVVDVGNRLIKETSDHAQILLQLIEEQNNLKTAQIDLEDSKNIVENIGTQITNFQKIDNEFRNNYTLSKKQYEDSVDEIIVLHKQSISRIKKNDLRLIRYHQNKFELSLNNLMESYKQSILKVINLAQIKMNKLKYQSLRSRITVSSLFTDYCDASLYLSFNRCSRDLLPTMGDTFDQILQKLRSLQWESLFSLHTFPGIPKQFNGNYILNSTTLNKYGLSIMDELKFNNEIRINLNDLDEANKFAKFYRIRIDSTSLVLLNHDGQLIQSKGKTFGNDIQIEIRFPMIFNDTDQFGTKHTFLAHDFTCQSDYTTKGPGNIYFTIQSV